MKTIDFILIIPLLYGAFLGFKRGLTITIFKFLGVLLGLVLGFKLLHWGIEWLAPIVGSHHDWLPVLSFVIIFVGVIILVNLAGKFLKKFLDFILLGIVDNIVGALLNALMWGFFVGTILLVAKRLEISDFNHSISESMVGTKLIQLSSSLLAFLTWITPAVKELVHTVTPF